MELMRQGCATRWSQQYAIAPRKPPHASPWACCGGHVPSCQSVRHAASRIGRLRLSSVSASHKQSGDESQSLLQLLSSAADSTSEAKTWQQQGAAVAAELGRLRGAAVERDRLQGQLRNLQDALGDAVEALDVSGKMAKAAESVREGVDHQARLLDELQIRLEQAHHQQVRDTEIAAATFRELQEALADAEVQLQDSHNDRSMAVALEEQLQDVRAQLEDAVAQREASEKARLDGEGTAAELTASRDAVAGLRAELLAARQAAISAEQAAAAAQQDLAGAEQQVQEQQQALEEANGRMQRFQRGALQHAAQAANLENMCVDVRKALLSLEVALGAPKDPEAIDEQLSAAFRTTAALDRELGALQQEGGAEGGGAGALQPQQQAAASQLLPSQQQEAGEASGAAAAAGPDTITTLSAQLQQAREHGVERQAAVDELGGGAGETFPGQRVYELKNAESEVQQRCAALEEQSQQWKKAAATEGERARTAVDQAAQTRKSLKAKDAEVAAAQEGDEQRKREVRELQGAVEAARAQAAAAEKERSAMEEATKQIDKALFHAGEEVESAQDRVLDLEQQLREAGHRAAEAEHGAAEAAGKLEEASRQSNSEVAAAEERLKQAEENVAELQGQVRDLEAEAAVLKNRTDGAPVGGDAGEAHAAEDDEGVAGEDGEDVEAMLEREAVIASDALDRAESAEGQVLALQQQLEAAEGAAGGGYGVAVLEEVAAAQAAAAASMANQSDLRRQVRVLQQQLDGRQPAANAGSVSGSPAGLFGSGTSALRAAETQIEQLTAENAALRETAERRARTIVQSKQFISQYLERLPVVQPADAISSAGASNNNSSNSVGERERP